MTTQHGEKLRFCLDENIVPRLSLTMNKLYKDFEFKAVSQLALRGTTDQELFKTLRELGFHAIITQDFRQLSIPNERQMLIETGLHWIGFSQGPYGGQNVVAYQTAILSAGLPLVLQDWRSVPSAYKLPPAPTRGLEIEHL